MTALLLAGLVGPLENISPARAQNTGVPSPLTTVRSGLCDTDEAFAIAVHGGAVFSRDNHEPKVEYLQQVLSQARGALASGAKAIDIVEAVIMEMENSGHFNAGRGAIANQAGVVEMDASIMEGRLLKAGAVASLKASRNPVSAARLVMDRSPHVMLVGPDADSFVQENGGAVADAAYFFYGGRNYANVPLPDDIVVTPPDDRITPSKAAFSGTWAGVWQGSINHVLVVEDIGPDGAEVVYALGPAPYFPDGKGLYRRLTAVFLDGGLQVTEPSDLSNLTFIITYRLNPDGSLTASAKEKQSGTIEGPIVMRRLSDLAEEHDGGTVGAAARDRCGDLAAGTSTGGFGSKTPGRVGDSPIIGAGTYADNATAAISATGHGEFFMRHVVAYAITAAMAHKGLSVDEAATKLIKRDLFRKGLRGGVIAVDREGNVAMPYNTEGMVRGSASHRSPPSVRVY
jgi:beta-aspartyl-peptidase (threonine type)